MALDRLDRTQPSGVGLCSSVGSANSSVWHLIIQGYTAVDDICFRVHDLCVSQSTNRNSVTAKSRFQGARSLWRNGARAGHRHCLYPGGSKAGEVGGSTYNVVSSSAIPRPRLPLPRPDWTLRIGLVKSWTQGQRSRSAGASKILPCVRR